MKRLRDEWDVALEQMFEALVEAGEWEVAGRDAQGRPTSWRMTDLKGGCNDRSFRADERR